MVATSCVSSQRKRRRPAICSDGVSCPNESGRFLEFLLRRRDDAEAEQAGIDEANESAWLQAASRQARQCCAAARNSWRS